MQYSMFLVTKSIRKQSVKKLVQTLAKRLDEESAFKGIRFSLNERNRPVVKQFLARMTEFVESFGNGLELCRVRDHSWQERLRG